AISSARVVAFGDRRVEVETRGERRSIPAEAAYVLIGYEPETGLMERAGVQVDPVTKVPRFDPETFETDVPGLYVAGTIQAGSETHRIFIENSRDHGERIVGHLASRSGVAAVSVPGE
ncbi:MAG: pyridine nucleotide-disulfide oxidoreductase, partial [Holophagales bacterium]|nr:pyridine nucleotide-disulfide oxidoreductase [Holophagales bacterium]